MRIGEIASSAQYQMDDQFQNLVFPILKISKTIKISKISNFVIHHICVSSVQTI